LLASEIEFLSVLRIIAFGSEEGFVVMVFNSKDEYIVPSLPTVEY
jgi:hypothetical protein